MENGNNKPHGELSVTVQAEGDFAFKMEGCSVCLVNTIGHLAAGDNRLMAMLTAALNKAWAERHTKAAQNTISEKGLQLTHRQN